MARIEPIDVDQAEGKTKELLDQAKQKMGGVPNILATMAHSPAVLGMYLNAQGALSESSLSASLREQIALAIANENGCEYCASAHSALAKSLNVDEAEITHNLAGDSPDERTRAALRFAKKLVQERGWVSDEDLEAVRDAGFSDAELLEIVAVTAINLFTNYFNHVAETEVDFPKVELAGSS